MSMCVCVCFYNPIKVSDNLITGSSKAAQRAHALNVAKRTTKKAMGREKNEIGKGKVKKRDERRERREKRGGKREQSGARGSS